MVKAMPIHDAPSRAGDSSDLLFLDVDGVLHSVGADYSFSSRFFSHFAEWVALDDLPSSFDAGFERLVLTDPKRAFDHDSFHELRSHFLRFANER